MLKKILRTYVKFGVFAYDWATIKLWYPMTLAMTSIYCKVKGDDKALLAANIMIEEMRARCWTPSEVFVKYMCWMISTFATDDGLRQALKESGNERVLHFIERNAHLYHHYIKDVASEMMIDTEAYASN